MVSEPASRETANRKRAHLDAVLGADVSFATLTTGFERLRIMPQALPERDLDEVDLSTEVFGRRLAAPLLISCMTGGVGEAGPVNRALAYAAQSLGVAMGLGSGRVVLEDPAALPSFRVRDVAPDVLLFANLGAAQLHQYSPQACAELVGLCEADGLVLHLNAVQEALQPAGDTNFRGLVERISATVEHLHHHGLPVMVKEVGFGLSDTDIDQLVQTNVDGIDVAGAGGTNWARVEGARATDAARIAQAFSDWGRPTVDCLIAVRQTLDQRDAAPTVVASGGIRDGVDAVKALCLGADLAGAARGLLSAAAAGPEPARDTVHAWVRQMQIAVWAAGVPNIADLGAHLLVSRTL